MLDKERNAVAQRILVRRIHRECAIEVGQSQIQVALTTVRHGTLYMQLA